MSKRESIDLKVPAALAALAQGDRANALIASTPGGIEAQEAQGQRDLVGSQKLPRSGPWKELVELGVVKGENLDELFCAAVLPEGWAIVATEHSMWSELRDANGKVIAMIFYKAAFYDQRAFFRLEQT